jgi:hypothetical protein
MSTGLDSLCSNCGSDLFYIAYNLTIGSHDAATQFELLKCTTCGQLKNNSFETTRDS